MDIFTKRRKNQWEKNRIDEFVLLLPLYWKLKHFPFVLYFFSYRKLWNTRCKTEATISKQLILVDTFTLWPKVFLAEGPLSVLFKEVKKYNCVCERNMTSSKIWEKDSKDSANAILEDSYLHNNAMTAATIVALVIVSNCHKNMIIVWTLWMDIVCVQHNSRNGIWLGYPLVIAFELKLCIETQINLPHTIQN